jgi:hypothetical protein
MDLNPGPYQGEEELEGGDRMRCSKKTNSVDIFILFLTVIMI